MKKIVIFTASNSRKSINALISNIVTKKIKEKYPLEIEEDNIRNYPLPLYSEEIEENGVPKQASSARALFTHCDALIICVPEHNSTIPAAFKNLIDWVSRLGDDEQLIFPKCLPILLLSTSPGKRGGLSNLNHLAEVIPWWGADVRGQLPIGDFYNNYQDGNLSRRYDEELDTLLGDFISSIETHKQKQ